MAILDRAAIKRATLAANRAVEQLDMDQTDKLTRLFKEAQAAIVARIQASAGHDGSIALQELRSLLAQVEGHLAALSEARNLALQGAIQTAAEYGAKVYEGLATAGGLPAASSMRIAEEAVFLTTTFMAADGLRLSDRLWRLDRGARDALVNAIESAVIQGHGAAQAAREFLARGQGVPADVAAAVGKGNARALSGTAQALMTGQGGALDNAMRVFRTEINRAHGEAYMKGGEDLPGFAGWRFLLSPAHPEPDICDLLSEQNLHGLGPGVYPSREACPWPAHPNTLSFVEIVFDEDVTAADRAGKETPEDALARLPLHKREGAIGKAKTALFDAGVIRRGSFRAPLYVVKQRLERHVATPSKT